MSSKCQLQPPAEAEPCSASATAALEAALPGQMVPGPSVMPSTVLAALAQLGLEVMAGAAAFAPPPVITTLAPSQLPLADVDEVAAMLGVSRWTIYRWSEAGRIPCVRAGRKVRFVLGEVIAALRSQPVEHATQATQAPRTAVGRGRRRASVTGARVERRADRAPATRAGECDAPSPRGDAERLRAAVAATRALGK